LLKTKSRTKTELLNFRLRVQAPKGLHSPSSVNRSGFQQAVQARGFTLRNGFGLYRRLFKSTADIINEFPQQFCDPGLFFSLLRSFGS
jgi:hypothetical protein